MPNQREKYVINCDLLTCLEDFTSAKSESPVAIREVFYGADFIQITVRDELVHMPLFITSTSHSVLLGKYFPRPITLTQFISSYCPYEQSYPLSVLPSYSCLLASADRGVMVLSWYAQC